MITIPAQDNFSHFSETERLGLAHLVANLPATKDFLQQLFTARLNATLPDLFYQSEEAFSQVLTCSSSPWTALASSQSQPAEPPPYRRPERNLTTVANIHVTHRTSGSVTVRYVDCEFTRESVARLTASGLTRLMKTLAQNSQEVRDSITDWIVGSTLTVASFQALLRRMERRLAQCLCDEVCEHEADWDGDELYDGGVNLRSDCFELVEGVCGPDGSHEDSVDESPDYSEVEFSDSSLYFSNSMLDQQGAIGEIHTLLRDLWDEDGWLPETGDDEEDEDEDENEDEDQSGDGEGSPTATSVFYPDLPDMEGVMSITPMVRLFQYLARNGIPCITEDDGRTLQISAARVLPEQRQAISTFRQAHHLSVVWTMGN